MYQKIQCVGYELYTGPRFINRSRKDYPGILSEFDDIAQRLAWIGQVVDVAQKAVPGKNKTSDGTILRICMMPEFLMRGAMGAYDMRTIDAGIRQLQTLVGDARYADWLFVFGTLVGRSHPTEDGLDGGRIIDREGPVETYNICPVVRGGWNADGTDDPRARVAATSVVMKEHLSGIDFIRTTENDGAWARVDYLPPVRGGGAGRERQRWGDDGAANFTIQSVTFGLEICLDHAQGRLKDSPPRTGEPLVQVQLIPSCGMSIQTDAVVAMAGGWVFNVDGFLSRHTVLREIAVAPTLAAPDAVLKPPLAGRAIDLPDPPPGFDQLYADGPGRLTVYDPVDLPLAANA